MRWGRERCSWRGCRSRRREFLIYCERHAHTPDLGLAGIGPERDALRDLENDEVAAVQAVIEVARKDGAEAIVRRWNSGGATRRRILMDGATSDELLGYAAELEDRERGRT